MLPGGTRAIFFDLDNTLVDRDAVFLAWAHDWFARVAGEPIGPTIAERLRLIDHHGWSGRRAFAATIASEFPALRLTAPDVESALANELPDWFATHLRPNPEMTRLLETLSRRARLAIITNGGASTQRAKLRAAGLESLHAFVSGELGVEKPSRELFLRALEWAGCAPDEAVMIGDHPEHDIAGARAAGLHALWVSHGDRWPSSSTPPPHVRSVLELAC